MRYVLAVILLCAVAAPAASAPRAGNPRSVSLKTDSVDPGVKRSKAPAQRQSRGGVNSGGIHPLVGSGDY